MSADTRTVVWCNGPRGACRERIDEAGTKAEVRRIARQRGWLTAVYHDGTKPPRGGPHGLFDFCPDHKPAPKEG